jgi:hypothetical protein
MAGLKSLARGVLNAAAKGVAPSNTTKAYKLFRTNDNGDLFPLFVNANDRVPMGEWLDAEVGSMNAGGKVNSKIGPLAFRPGWHAGDLPIATHIGGKSMMGMTKPDYRPSSQVWAEIDMPNDFDWQSIANERMEYTKGGKPKPVTAHITDQIPYGGFYRYKTNPNMTGNWLIGGQMRVNRVLPDEEVLDINASAGTADLPRLKDLMQGKRPNMTREAEKELERYLAEIGG